MPPAHAVAEDPSTYAGPEPTPPFVVTPAYGGAELRLASLPLGPLARLENVLVEYPGPIAANDLPHRLRNRRGRLIEAALVIDRDRLAAELDRPAVRARLAAAGVSDVRAGLSEGSFRLVGRATAGDRDAAFTARAVLDREAEGATAEGTRRPAGAPRIRIAIQDLRIYGFLPVAAPLVARAMLAALVPAKPGLRGATDFDALGTALLETFAARGWRLPDTRFAHLQPVEIASEQIALRWRAESAATATPTSNGAAAARARADSSELDEGDGLLARGDARGALDAYRRALKRTGGGPAATRVLEILVASSEHVIEADDLAAEILTRQSEEPLPLLVRAVAAAERGDPALAADAFEQIATIARRRNEDEDVVIARLAAAEQWLRAGKLERARRLAEQVLATMPAHAAGETTRFLQILCERLIAKGDVAEADQVFESRLVLAVDEAARAVLTVERARARLLARDGVAGALVVLASLPLERAPRDAVELRAELGERARSPDDALPALDELVARARQAGDEAAALRLEDRAARVAQRAPIAPAAPAVALVGGATDGAATAPTALRLAGTGPGPAVGGASASAADLEQLLLENPSDTLAAERLAAIYARIVEPRERAEALSGLLRRAPDLPADRRKAIYASLGQSAEASGDLDRAAQAYWRAATIEAEPMQRAGFLVSHARVLLARGETDTAITELEEALARAPEHAGALALRGDLAFRAQDWARARAIYAALALSPGAAEVISRELLLYRRAQIAQAGGPDLENEAEMYLREVAILNPRHVEAREAMADIALRRGDFGGAALRLEEVLRLLPLDALDQLLDVRQRLGGVYLQLQDWASARYYLELVLAQEPSRVVPLKILIDVYLRLHAHREAADACARLARLHAEPRQRAAILYRQGEILRSFLDDEAGAVDAYLRASDLDPQFVPALVRLADFYWRQGGFEDLAEMAADLEAADFAPDEDSRDLPLRLAIATRLAPHAGAGPASTSAPVPRADGPIGEVTRRARLLAEASSFLGARSPRDLDPVLDALADQGRALDDGGQGPASGFFRALEGLVQEDPACANMGAVRALGRAAERGGWTAAARGLYSLLVFVDPGDAAAAELQALGAARTVDPQLAELEGMMALLAQKQPLQALEAIAEQDPLSVAGDATAPAHRRELLRTLAARELVSTMLSLDYQRLVS